MNVHVTEDGYDFILYILRWGLLSAQFIYVDI